MKRVTDRKLVAASRALLALVDCDDIETVLDKHWLKTVDAYYETSGGFRMPENEEPPHSSNELLVIARAFSNIAVPG